MKCLKGIRRWCVLLGCQDFNFLPTDGFSINPIEVKLFCGGAESNRAGVSKAATASRLLHLKAARNQAIVPMSHVLKTRVDEG